MSCRVSAGKSTWQKMWGPAATAAPPPQGRKSCSYIREDILHTPVLGTVGTQILRFWFCLVAATVGACQFSQDSIEVSPDEKFALISIENSGGFETGGPA